LWRQFRRQRERFQHPPRKEAPASELPRIPLPRVLQGNVAEAGGPVPAAETSKQKQQQTLFIQAGIYRANRWRSSTGELGVYALLPPVVFLVAGCSLWEMQQTAVLNNVPADLVRLEHADGLVNRRRKRQLICEPLFRTP